MLNAQAYIEVSFADTGDGLDASTIDGDELSLGGTGVGTAVLEVGAPTLVSGTTYRYGFSGSFVDGSVDVTFEAGSFADLAETPNTNAAETEGFTVVTPPPPADIQIMDDGDAGYTAGGFTSIPAPPNPGYETDYSYSFSGEGNTASWSFTAPAPGTYRVSTTWKKHPNRATNAPYTIYDGVTQLSVATINQRLSPVADITAGGVNFEHLGEFTVSSGTLVVELSGAGNGVTIADAVRVELVAPAGPDTTAPTADLSSPANGDSIDPAVLNAQGYIEVSFTDTGDGIDTSSIDGDSGGIPDTEDLFPDDAEFNNLSDYVDFIINYITDDQAIFATDWKDPKNEADFVAKLETVLELVLAAEQAQDPEWAALLYSEALRIVDDELTLRTDGFHGGSLANDWLVVQEAQDIIHPDLLSLSEYLSLVLE